MYNAAHNVYIQVLCETGLMGFTIYMLAITMTLVEGIRLAKLLSHHPEREIRFAASFALTLQIFYLLYSLSGNCLYDIVFYFYGLSLALTSALKYYVHRQKFETQNLEVQA